MLELGSSGSVRGVSSNGHPYRDPASFMQREGDADGVVASAIPLPEG